MSELHVNVYERPDGSLITERFKTRERANLNINILTAGGLDPSYRLQFRVRARPRVLKPKWEDMR